MAECFKQGYETRQQAERVIHRMKRHKRDGGGTLQSYRCRWCPLWHVGNSRKIERSRDRR